MSKLSAGQIAHILENIADAEADIDRMVRCDDEGSRAIWQDSAKLHLKFARDKIHRASLGDVAVEQIPGSAADASFSPSVVPRHAPETSEVADPGRGAHFVPANPTGGKCAIDPA